jgi:hypothetical protein
MNGKRHPKAAEGLVHSPLDGGAAIYQPGADRVHHLNHTGAVIMEMCDGEHSVQEIVDFLQLAFELPAPPEDEVRDLLQDMTNMGLVTWTGAESLDGSGSGE